MIETKDHLAFICKSVEKNKSNCRGEVNPNFNFVRAELMSF